LNVLLITFSFPPAGGVGVLRALSLAKYLPENGIRVDVLTARNAPAVGKDLALLAQVPESVTVHRTWTLDLPFALRKAIKKRVTKGAAQNTAAKPAGGGNPLKKLIGNLLLPDPQVGWLPFAFPAARRIIRSRNIDLVLITVPPFSTVRLVTKLRKVFPKLPIVLDFRDEWLTTTIDLVSFNNNDRARSIAHAAEREAVRDATTVVAVTEAARLEIMGRYPGQDPAKFRCIPNGFDTPVPTAAPAPSAAKDTILLTYLGTVYGSTDPATFIEAILSLPPELRARLRVRYIGHIETPAYRESLLRLGDTVELKGFVPQAEALRAIQDTDYLLLITHDRINVAAKFYDYLGSGKPIVAAVHPGGDVRKLLEETRAGRWADSADPAAIAALLTSILTPNTTAPPAPDLTRIAAYHRRALTQRYADLLSNSKLETRDSKL
jgi:glycosyltransferase involved in cell wall biosynthesis